MTLKPEHIVEELNRTPKLKRDLIMKMMEVMLDSEAFLEAYPTLYDPRIADVDLEYREKVCEEMAQIIVRLFRKNKVRPDDAEKVLDRAREDYAGASQLEQAKQHAKCSLDAFTKRRNGVSCICLSILFVILGVAINL